MPANRLEKTPTRVSRFDVLGEDADQLAGFVGHLGLFWPSTGDLAAGDLAEICDMGPPLARADAGGMRPDSWGAVPCTRLKIVAGRENGELESVEVQLTEQQLEGLLEKGRKARQKIKALVDYVDATIPGGLPDLPGMQIPRKDQDDG